MMMDASAHRNHILDFLVLYVLDLLADPSSLPRLARQAQPEYFQRSCESSVTRWLDYLFKNWLSMSMKICQMA